MGEDKIWLQGRQREAASLQAIISALHDQPETAGSVDGAPVRGAGVSARVSEAAARASRTPS